MSLYNETYNIVYLTVIVVTTANPNVFDDKTFDVTQSMQKKRHTAVGYRCSCSEFPMHIFRYICTEKIYIYSYSIIM